MKTLTVLALTLLLAASAMAQNANSQTTTNQTDASARAARKRPPVFRASKEQIKQAQTVLKQRGFYTGEPTGKLDDVTRDGLKKYQQAEGLKATGTLNATTLEKMNIQMSDRQKEVWKQIRASQANANSR